MSVTEHRKHAPKESLRIGVLTVSSTRQLADDKSGDVICGLLLGANHLVHDRKLVTDEVDAIRTAVVAMNSAGCQALVITGGTGFSKRDVTPEAIRPLLGREIPGFGELFRMLSWEQVGSAAMLSRALGGVHNGMVVFALPGSSKAVTLAVNRLILPEVGHLVGQMNKVEQVQVPAPVSPISVEMVASNKPTPLPSPERGEAPVGAWRKAIASLGAQVELRTPPTLPDAIVRLAPVASLIASAGERGTLVLPGGRQMGLYGWPDLRRPGSKVLAIGEGGVLCEVLALHRHPARVGLCVPGGVLPDPNDVQLTSEAVTGRVPDAAGELFAITSDAIWLRQGELAVRWDGNKLHEDGSCKQVLSTLMLEWHAR
ncbi:MAG: hypothetical protein GWP91_11600 [Rhodobacterales bacterium]|nr:hypothetical protein [Rhodobacterales bacterium]